MSGVEVGQNCFVQRVSTLPLVAAASETAVTQYQRAKGWNSLLKAYMTFLENSALVAKEKIDPLVGRAQAPLDKLTEVACKGLDKVEEMFPVVKMSPEELKQAGVEYYAKSYVPKGVNPVKMVGTTWEVAKTAVGSAITSSAGRAAGLANYGLGTISSTLTYCEYVVDTYVVEDEEQRREHPRAGTSQQEQLRIIIGKLYSGVQLKASRKFTDTRKFVSINLSELERAANQVKTAGGTAIVRVGEAGRNYTHAFKDWSITQISRIQPEQRLLQFVKGSTRFFVVVSSRALNIAAPTLSTISERASQLNGQLLGAEKVISEAESFHQLTDEAKERLLNEERINNTYEYLSSIRPFSWLDRKAKPAPEAEAEAFEMQESESEEPESSESGSD